MAGLTEKIINELYEQNSRYQIHYKWSYEQIQLHQQSALRALLHHCYTHSPWYRHHLQQIDIDNFSIADLPQLPVLTKTELMDNWDNIVTDKSLRLKDVLAWFDRADFSTPLRDRYLCWFTGGTSGQKGVVVWSISDFVRYISHVYRPTLYAMTEKNSTQNLRLATIVARYPVHMSHLLWVVPFLPQVTCNRLDINSDVAHLAEQLVNYQPSDIVAYPSALAMVARYCKFHHLEIRPQRIILTAEPVIDEDINAIKEICRGAIIANFYGATEAGPLAITCHTGSHQHLCADATLVEPVDNHQRPVMANCLSDDLYVTNLINYTLPLIRYQTGDKIEISHSSCDCGTNYPILAKIEGRKFPIFYYGDIAVPTSNIYFMLIAHPHILSLQGKQIDNGIAIQLHTVKPLDLTLLQIDLEKYFINRGLTAPIITLSTKFGASDQRHAESSKLSYFIATHPNPS
ncbi:MAG: phenylacetate--CoA ligase family protein [Gammaproteobacteria bacterium]|nr:phenylacetate--CoA ligase family protein [Gammaproteobacteria bacterium]